MDEIDDLVADLPDEIVDYIGELQTSNESLTKSLEEAQTTEEEEVEDTRDAFEKAFDDLDEESAAAIQERLDKLDVLEAKIEKSEQETADTEYIAKARAYDGVGDPAVIGPALRRLAEIYPEDAATFEKAFTAAAEQMETSDLYEELGHEIHKSSDTDTQVEAIAKSYQEANPELSSEESRAMVWENNPDLYEEHSREQQSRQRL